LGFRDWDWEWVSGLGLGLQIGLGCGSDFSGQDFSFFWAKSAFDSQENLPLLAILFVDLNKHNFPDSLVKFFYHFIYIFYKSVLEGC